MSITVHHQPVSSTNSYTLHAWENSQTWDVHAAAGAGTRDFVLSSVSDPRQLQFMYYTTEPSGAVNWEPNDYIRYIWQTAPAEVWSFDFSARLIYDAPYPLGVVFSAGDVLTFNVVTQSRFAGGAVYAWDPYNPAGPTATFAQTSRAAPVSTFAIALAAWMTNGFHFKLVDAGGNFEPNSANRVWRPCDGDLVYLKSGQVSLRKTPLVLTTAPVEVLCAATMTPPPNFDLVDPVENLTLTFTPTLTSPADNGLFQIANYAPTIYPQAMYNSFLSSGEADSPIVRPFPADPSNPATPSCVVLGIGGISGSFPPIADSVTISIDPHGSAAFAGGVSVEVGVGTSVTKHQVVPAVLATNGMWMATVTVAQTVANWAWLDPSPGPEPTPYGGLDLRRWLTPPTTASTYYTAAGVYGATAAGPTAFADPPSRATLMQAAFGPAAGANIFGPAEMPHGVTVLNGETYFVVHAPHAAGASLVLVNVATGGTLSRTLYPMTLTSDTLYWWCALPSASAPSGTYYRFLFNETVEVMDPAAREILDRGNFNTSVGDNPNDTTTSWSLVVDVPLVTAAAHQAPWQTMGWEALLMYELHTARFTDISVGSLSPLGLVADELKNPNRLNGVGYLLSLGATALQIMPVTEFDSGTSWGYNPAYFFAVEHNYGGCQDLANLVNVAHGAGKAVLLDLVYSHANGSSLTMIAPEVYCNGMDAWGNQINNGHPMVLEFFRQATVYLWQTYGVDGFRFDATSSIIGNNGWNFLGGIRSAVRAAAAAAGMNAPYLVGENDTSPWNMTNPAWPVMDGQWDVDEVSDLGQAAYDPWQAADDHSGNVAGDMNIPESWLRPFYEASRYGESHDTVSAQGSGAQRIAARPPLGMGLQMAKAVGTIALLSNGIPMFFMGEEVGCVAPFSLDSSGPAVDPMAALPTDNNHVLAWFQAIIGLRNDPTKGFRGDANVQSVKTARRTVAFVCGGSQSHFVVVTFGTENQQQNSGWLGMPGGVAFKEIFNSSWPAYQTAGEPEQGNGGYSAMIYSGNIINLPYIGAVVFEVV